MAKKNSEPKEELSAFERLYRTEIEQYVQQKGRMDYLPWSIAWRLLKQCHPTATFEKHLNAEGVPYFPIKGGKGGFVRVSVTIETAGKALTMTESLPVLDNRNKSIDNPSSFDINNSNQRCLAKAIGYHGLGLALWTREDIPREWSGPEKDAFLAALPEGWGAPSPMEKVNYICATKGWPHPSEVSPERRTKLIEVLTKMG